MRGKDLAFGLRRFPPWDAGVMIRGRLPPLCGPCVIPGKISHGVALTSYSNDEGAAIAVDPPQQADL